MSGTKTRDDRHGSFARDGDGGTASLGSPHAPDAGAVVN